MNKKDKISIIEYIIVIIGAVGVLFSENLEHKKMFLYIAVSFLFIPKIPRYLRYALDSDDTVLKGENH